MSQENQLGIKIIVAMDGEEICHRTSTSFESAEEDLGKLETWFEAEQNKYEQKSEDVETLEEQVQREKEESYIPPTIEEQREDHIKGDDLEKIN